MFKNGKQVNVQQVKVTIIRILIEVLLASLSDRDQIARPENNKDENKNERALMHRYLQIEPAFFVRIVRQKYSLISKFRPFITRSDRLSIGKELRGTDPNLRV